MSELIHQPIPIQTAQPARRRKRAVTTIIMLVLLALIVIVGIIFAADATVVRTIQLNAQATAVVHGIRTGQPAIEQEQVYRNIIRTPSTYTDTLDNASNFWQASESNGNSCTFKQNSYDVHIGTQQPYTECLEADSNYTNFLYQIHMKFVSNTWGGIIFRASAAFTSYIFSISPNGFYSFGGSLSYGHSATLAYGRSAAIHTGLNQDNTIAIIARGYNISLFVNGQFVDSVQDGTFTQGAIGVYAGTLIGTPADVTFSNVSVWTL